MYGKSWGGFNGLQVAFEQPPALKAIISLFSTGKKVRKGLVESSPVRSYQFGSKPQPVMEILKGLHCGFEGYIGLKKSYNILA